MIAKATELNFIDSPDALVRLWGEYKNTVQTNVSDLQAPGYAQMAAKIDENSLAFLTLGVVASPYTTPQGAQVLLPSPEGVRQIVDAFLSDNQLQEESATIEVQNGTTETGYAQQSADYLVSLGLPLSSVTAVEVGNLASDTEIVLFADKRYTAERIAGWLGVSTEQIRDAGPQDPAMRTTAADIVILIGDDAQVEDVSLLEPTATP